MQATLCHPRCRCVIGKLMTVLRLSNCVCPLRNFTQGPQHSVTAALYVATPVLTMEVLLHLHASRVLKFLTYTASAYLLQDIISWYQQLISYCSTRNLFGPVSSGRSAVSPTKGLCFTHILRGLIHAFIMCLMEWFSSLDICHMSQVSSMCCD